MREMENMKNNLRKKFWYEDGKFENQYYSYPKNLIIENGWSIFKKIIIDHKFKKDRISILDSGCGDGMNTLGRKKILYSLNIQYSIDAADFNPNRLNKVKKFFPEVNVFMFDIIKDKINKTYDLIIFNHVLEHIKEDELALKKLSNLLNEEGLIILGVQNESCFLAQLRNKVLQRKILKYIDHVNFYTLEKLKSKLEKYFNITAIYREGYFLPHLKLTNMFRKHIIGIKVENFLSKINPSQCADTRIKIKNG